MPSPIPGAVVEAIPTAVVETDALTAARPSSDEARDAAPEAYIAERPLLSKPTSSVLESTRILGPIAEPQEEIRGVERDKGISPAAAVPAPRGRHKLLYVAGGLAVLAIVGLVVWYFLASPTNRMMRAIERGDLVAPEGASAFDFYMQLKSGGLDPSTRNTLREKALPKLARVGEGMLQKRTEGASYKESELQALVRLYQWASELAPEDARTLARYNYAQGVTALIAGKHSAALQFLRRSTELDSNWALAFNDLGRAYVKLNDHYHAEENYQKALVTDPNWVFPQLNLGGVYLYRKQWDLAEQAYVRATQMDGTLATPWYFLGQTYEAQKRFIEAISAYERAVQLAERRPSSAFRVDALQQRTEKLRSRIR